MGTHSHSERLFQSSNNRQIIQRGPADNFSLVCYYSDINVLSTETNNTSEMTNNANGMMTLLRKALHYYQQQDMTHCSGREGIFFILIDAL